MGQESWQRNSGAYPEGISTSNRDDEPEACSNSMLDDKCSKFGQKLCEARKKNEQLRSMNCD